MILDIVGEDFRVRLWALAVLISQAWPLLRPLKETAKKGKTEKRVFVFVFVFNVEEQQIKLLVISQSIFRVLTRGLGLNRG